MLKFLYSKYKQVDITTYSLSCEGVMAYGRLLSSFKSYLQKEGGRRLFLRMHL